MRLLFTSAFLLIFLAEVHGQAGGDNTYEFLNISHSAFASATGGITVSHGFDDLSLPYFNPALLSELMNNNISLSFSTYLAGITYGYASWATTRQGIGNFGGGISFISYGKFKEADATGNLTGTFTASEYALNIIYSRSIDSMFTVGINIKPVLSHLERYFSGGICADIGATYHNEKLLLDAGLAIRNAGFQIKSYTGEGAEPLPFEIVAGVTKRLAHAPFRFSLTLRHIEKPDLIYDYDTTDDIAEAGLGENILKHMILGVELLPSDNFWAGAGFNYQRRSEMRTTQRAGTAGFSWGFGFRARAFSFAYGHDTFHLAGGSNHLTLTLRPEVIFKNTHH